MNHKALARRAVIAGVFAAATSVVPIANAGALIGTGYANGSQTFGLHYPPSHTGSPAAGGFVGTWNGDPLHFWCAELTQTFSFNHLPAYDYTASIPNDATFTMLGQLFNEGYATALDSTKNSAAFQLAIWEILYDGDLDLGAGDFRVTNANGHADTVQAAQDLLTNLHNFTDTYDIALLHNDDHQDFITGLPPRGCCAKQVPEPAPLALIGVGILAMIVASRRRATDAPTH